MVRYKHTVYFAGIITLFVGMITLIYCILSPRIHKYHLKSQQILSMIDAIQKTPMSKIVSGNHVSQNENKSISSPFLQRDSKHLIFTAAKKNYVSVLSMDETVNESNDLTEDTTSIVTYVCSWEADLDVDIIKALQEINEQSTGMLVVNHFELRKASHTGSQKAMAKVTLSYFRHNENAKE